MRCSPWWMHANVCALPVFGDSFGAGDPNRSGLRAGWEWLRLQAKEFGEYSIRSACCAKLLRSISNSDMKRWWWCPIISSMKFSKIKGRDTKKDETWGDIIQILWRRKWKFKGPTRRSKWWTLSGDRRNYRKMCLMENKKYVRNTHTVQRTSNLT